MELYIANRYYPKAEANTNKLESKTMPELSELLNRVYHRVKYEYEQNNIIQESSENKT